MKLLFFSARLKCGGAERVLVNITNELVKCGHDVTIALNSNESNYEVDPHIKIISAPLFNRYHSRNIIKRLVRNIILNKSNSRHTRNAINVVHPDVIISFLHCNMKAILRYHGDIPIIHSEHNAFDRWVDLKYYYERFFLNRFFDKVFVLTPFDQGYAMAKGLKNTMVMPNPNTFASISKEKYDTLFLQRKSILVCGRINSWYIKGMDLAIEAFARVAEQHPGIHLDIAGAGDESSIGYLKQLAQSLRIENRVHFLGQHEDIEKVMQQHMLFLLSSRTEGFPMVVTEAMSQGLPCVAFERLASSIIIDGEDGYLVENGDVQGLSSTMLKLISSNDGRYNMGLEATSSVSRFSASVVAEKWERVFQRLVTCH